MDYTPISTRRVALAFGLTGFIALLPLLFLFLQSGHAEALAFRDEPVAGYRGLVLGAGSIMLTVFLVGVLMLSVAIGRRMTRRPSRT